MPAIGLLAERNIKCPQNPSKNQTHFMVCEVSTNTVSRTKTEWFECVTIVVVEGRTWITLRLWKPAFWQEVVGFVEVLAGLVSGVVMYSHTSLSIPVSIFVH